MKKTPARIDADALLDWYDRNARQLMWRVPPAARAQGVRPDPYRVWVSEIMLQQTGVVTVGPYFADFMARWPDVDALAAADLDAVLSRWAGLGYYARARNMHAAARQIVATFSGRFPASSVALQTIKGIGPYTAAAIAAICFDERVGVVDGNVERVVARLTCLDRPVREAKPEIGAFVQGAVPERAGDFAQALMDLGATICAPRQALCDRCPLAGDCLAGSLADPTIYPVKSAKPMRPVRRGHAYVLRDRDGAVYLRQRSATGLLALMMEVPGSDWSAALEDVAYPVAGEWQVCGQVVHVFTHFRLELLVHVLTSAPQSGLMGGHYVPVHALGEQALPSLYKKVLFAAGVMENKKGRQQSSRRPVPVVEVNPGS